MTTTTWDQRRAAYTRIRAAMKVDLPEGESGAVKLATFTVSDEQAAIERMRAIFSGGRGVPAGTYTALYRNGGLWMSDTPDEQRDHMPFAQDVYDSEDRRILVGGLGLGMVVSALLQVPSVEHIDVIELAADVITLVGPPLTKQAAEAGKTLNIVQGDAMDPRKLFPTGTAWDASWMDIWQDLCTDNLAEMTTISRRLARRVKRQGFWGREILRARARRGR